MPGMGFIALLDDIASMMDKVAVMAKANANMAGAVADKTGQALGKSAGIVGDDVALGTEVLRVSELEKRIGLMSQRELKIVWEVAKGSAQNKVWISGLALGLSATAPWALTGLLTLGGAYLCMEGAEKVGHAVKAKFGKGAHGEGDAGVEAEEVKLTGKDLAAYEKDKIKGAVRTDMVLSGEIILIALGGMAALPIVGQAAGLAVIGVAMTVGVYGAVAGLVKMDDVGLYLLKKGQEKKSPLMETVGKKLMVAMPPVMKGLTVVGVAAMLGVGGTIMAHAIPGMGALLHGAEALSGVGGFLAATGLTAGLGLAVGFGVEKALHTPVGQWAAEKLGDASKSLSKLVKRVGKNLGLGAKPKPALALEASGPDAALVSLNHVDAGSSKAPIVAQAEAVEAEVGEGFKRKAKSTEPEADPAASRPKI